MGYDLTKNQAKILAGLNQTKNCTSAREVSQITNIPRESIYKILASLREMGLIQKSISNPEKYCSIPLKRMIAVLQQEKTKEFRKLEELTTQALFENNQKSEIIQPNNNSHFVLIPKKKQLINKIDQSITNSKKSVKITTSWKRHLQAITLYEKALNASISNGAKLQLFITMKQKTDKIPEKARRFYDYPNVSIKFVDTPPKVIVAIIDDQEVFLMTNPEADLVESPALWSKNLSLITALSTCFDSFWKNTNSITPRK